MELVPLGDSTTPPEDGPILSDTATTQEEVAFSSMKSDHAPRQRRRQTQRQEQSVRRVSQSSTLRDTAQNLEERKCIGHKVTVYKTLACL